MLVINRKFIERWSAEYDRRTLGTSAQTEEVAILNWLDRKGETRFLNKEYFVRVGCWKTPRYKEKRESNSEHNIIEATRSAYQARNDLEKLNILRQLNGVGIAVASTVLYYLQPNDFAIYDYHVRNSLKKAGRLTNVGKQGSSRAWFEYTRIVRRLSSLCSKTLREVEKALYAYDKWGRGRNELQGGRNGGTMKVMQHKNRRRLTQPEIKKRVDVIENNGRRALCYECLRLLQRNRCDAVHCREDNISVHDKDGLLLRFCPSTRYSSVRPKRQNGKLGRRVPILSRSDFDEILDDLRSWGRIAW